MRWPREFLDRVDQAAWSVKESRTEYLKKAADFRMKGRGMFSKKEQLRFDFEQFADWVLSSDYSIWTKEGFMKAVERYIETSSL